MLLLRFHISVCVLCWLVMKSMKILFRERYARYKRSSKKAKCSDRFFVYICPILNVIVAFAFVFMAFATDEFVDEVNKTIE